MDLKKIVRYFQITLSVCIKYIFYVCLYIVVAVL